MLAAAQEHSGPVLVERGSVGQKRKIAAKWGIEKRHPVVAQRLMRLEGAVPRTRIAGEVVAVAQTDFVVELVSVQRQMIQAVAQMPSPQPAVQMQSFQSVVQMRSLQPAVVQRQIQAAVDSAMSQKQISPEVVVKVVQKRTLRAVVAEVVQKVVKADQKQIPRIAEV